MPMDTLHYKTFVKITMISSEMSLSAGNVITLSVLQNLTFLVKAGSLSLATNTVTCFSQRVRLTWFIFEKMPATFPSQLVTQPLFFQTPSLFRSSRRTSAHFLLVTWTIKKCCNVVRRVRFTASSRAFACEAGWVVAEEGASSAGKWAACQWWPPLPSQTSKKANMSYLLETMYYCEYSFDANALQPPRTWGPCLKNCRLRHWDRVLFLQGYFLLKVKNAFLANKFPACSLGQIQILRLCVVRWGLSLVFSGSGPGFWGGGGGPRANLSLTGAALAACRPRGKIFPFHTLRAAQSKPKRAVCSPAV